MNFSVEEHTELKICNVPDREHEAGYQSVFIHTSSASIPRGAESGPMSAASACIEYGTVWGTSTVSFSKCLGDVSRAKADMEAILMGVLYVSYITEEMRIDRPSQIIIVTDSPDLLFSGNHELVKRVRAAISRLSFCCRVGIAFSDPKNEKEQRPLSIKARQIAEAACKTGEDAPFAVPDYLLKLTKKSAF